MTLEKIISYLKVYRNPQILAVVFWGISSGFPLLLIGSTLDRWLMEQGVTKTGIGLFSVVALPYTLKFVWAPVMDYLHIPYFSKRLGHRRSWSLLAQFCLMISVIALGQTHPGENIWMTALMAFIVVFFSASQDIIIEAFRVERLKDHEQAAGAANIVLGYRLGLLCSGAGALYMAEVMPWSTVYMIMSLLTLVGMAAILFSKEPEYKELKVEKNVQESYFTFLSRIIVIPFKDFMKRGHWYVLVAFIILYKAGEVLLGKMSMPFYTELGFTKTEIATVTKVYGFAATILGGLIGGALASRLGLLKSLMFCGIPQMLTNLLFVMMAYMGRDLNFLIIANSLDNLTAGMAAACLVALLSRMCRKGLAATQYALLSSLTGLSHKMFGALSGYMADQMSWSWYFLMTTFAAIPGLIILAWLIRQDKKHSLMSNVVVAH